MKEIWKSIEGYEGLYEISNFGNVKSLVRSWNFRDYGNGKVQVVKNKEKILKNTISKCGYIQARLSKNNKFGLKAVHRLVAKAFIPNPENKPQVNHIDGNKQNNRVDNLEWCSNRENQLHAWKLGLQTPYWKGKFGKDHITSKKVKQYDKNKNLIKIWDSVSEASKTLNINNTSISRCCLHHKYRHTAGGFIWEYL